MPYYKNYKILEMMFTSWIKGSQVNEKIDNDYDKIKLSLEFLKSVASSLSDITNEDIKDLFDSQYIGTYSSIKFTISNAYSWNIEKDEIQKVEMCVNCCNIIDVDETSTGYTIALSDITGELMCRYCLDDEYKNGNKFYRYGLERRASRGRPEGNGRKTRAN